MATFTAKSRVVQARSRMGQYAKRADMAANATVEEIVKQGARESRRMAPVGKKKDTRSGHTPLKRSIRTEVNGHLGSWYSTSKHALPQEKGARPHFIIGKGIKFQWRGAADRSGWFWWNHPAFLHYNWDPVNGVVIRHPGNKPQPFLEPAFDKVARHGATARTAKRIYRRYGL